MKTVKTDSRLLVHFEKKQFPYDGSQLHHLFAYEKFGLLGSSLVAWIGQCSIPMDKMVDGEDRFAKAEIRGDLMLHFIGEFYQPNPHFSVAIQRIFTSIVYQELLNAKPELLKKSFREGDDIYINKKKLSISIASVSAFSSMLHFAVNVKNSGTPVPTISLQELKISPEGFAKRILEKFSAEYTSLDEATQKVFFLK